MQICRICAVFGKLHGEELVCSPGFNLIYAPNESGKSTWTHFLRTMFYGFPSRDRGPLADKNRFAPWDGSAMQGRIDLLHGGTAYTLSRTTRRANAPMGEFRCTYTGTATDVAQITAQNCGDYFLGISREVFARSAYIGQNALAVDHNGELEQRIVSLITTGDEEISYTDSYDRLKKQLNRRKANSKVGEIPALEREIDALTRQLDAQRNFVAQAEAIKEKLQALHAQRRELLAQQAQWEQWLAQQQYHDYQAAQEEMQNAENRAAILREMTENFPDEATLSHLSALATAAAQTQVRVQAAQKAAQQSRQAAENAQAKLEAHTLYPRTEAQLQQKRSELLPPAIPKSPWLIELLCALGGLLSALVRIFDPDFLNFRSFLWIGISVACILAAGGTAVWHRLHRKKCAALSQQRTQQLAAFDEAVTHYHTLQKDTDIALDRAQQAEASAKMVLQEQQEQTTALLWQVQSFQSNVTDLSGVRLAITEAQQLRAAAVAAAQQAENAVLRCRILRRQLPDAPSHAASPITAPALDQDAIRAALQSNESAIAAMQSRLDMLTGELRALGDSDDLNSQLSQLQKQLKQSQADYQALALAMDTLEQAHTALQNRFSPALGARSAEIFSRITAGRYDKVLLSRDFSLAAEQSNDPTMRSIQLLSQGAADQLYLAVRLAICDMVLPQENAVPLILDDALMSFDDERLHAALDYLVQESKKRQILLFTCQKREQDYLRGREGVTCLTL